MCNGQNARRTYKEPEDWNLFVSNCLNPKKLNHLKTSMREACSEELATAQGAFHSLKHEDLWRCVSFPVCVVAWIEPIQYSLVHWRNKMQISTNGNFDLCTSGVRKLSPLAYT